jgi:hypothetical protein
VTIAAILLELGVPAHERPGHDELLEQALCPHSWRYGTDHDPDHKRTYEPPTQQPASTQKKCAAKT